MDFRIVKFYRQYLQQLDHPAFPPPDVLLEPAIQEQISYRMFDDSNRTPLPPLSYQRRILKVLTEMIESAVEDPDGDEISDRLIEHMAIKSTRRPMSAFKAAQQPSIVSYFLPSDLNTPNPVCIYIEEARNLIAARGTTGLRVWDACLHLASFLSTPPFSALIRGKSVLELGAGAGLLSILCAGPLHAAKVISTDGDGDVVENIAANARLNLSQIPQLAENFEARVLDWNDESSLPNLLRRNGTQVPLDVILGADITYASESLVPLVHIIGALQDLYPEVEVIISNAIRNEDTYNGFIDTCARYGFRVTVLDFDCPLLDQQTGFFHKTSNPPIRIVRLTRSLHSHSAKT